MLILNLDVEGEHAPSNNPVKDEALLLAIQKKLPPKKEAKWCDTLGSIVELKITEKSASAHRTNRVDLFDKQWLN